MQKENWSIQKVKDDAVEKFSKENLNKQLQSATYDYNLIYTQMNYKGETLFYQRERAIDLLGYVEVLINSIARRPKSFDSEIAEIQVNKQNFKDVCYFAAKELDSAQKSVMNIGASIAGGAAVASLAPSAALWVATTFGTASTGTAISTLSGAAAHSAAVAWLGGGAVAMGGGGMAAGNALLALAGPVGWGISGASLLTSIALFTNKKLKLNKEKKEEIESVLNNIKQVKEMDSQLSVLLEQTIAICEGVHKQYTECMRFYNADYIELTEDEQLQLGTLVNNAKVLACSLEKGVQGDVNG